MKTHPKNGNQGIVEQVRPRLRATVPMWLTGPMALASRFPPVRTPPLPTVCIGENPTCRQAWLPPCKGSVDHTQSSARTTRRGGRPKKSREPTGCDWLTRILVPRLGPRKHIRLGLIDPSTANRPNITRLTRCRSMGSREHVCQSAEPRRWIRSDRSSLKVEWETRPERHTSRQAMDPAKTSSTTLAR